MSDNPTSILEVDYREQRTAVLHLAGGGWAPPGNRQADWLMRQLRYAPDLAVHLSACRRELRAEFPRGTDPDVTVRRLLAHGPSNVYLTWHRTDGSYVYDGATPCALALPRGQDPRSPGFDLNDYLHNSRPIEPVPA